MKPLELKTQEEVNWQEYRKVSTIIAALRYFQVNLDDIDILQLEHFEDVDRLNSEEIDELCIRLNVSQAELYS